MKTKMTKAQRSELGRLLNSLRRTNGGGRPRLEGVERCPCGAMTAKRAKARCHKCEVAA
jgi:hypothetical protein